MAALPCRGGECQGWRSHVRAVRARRGAATNRLQRKPISSTPNFGAQKARTRPLHVVLEVFQGDVVNGVVLLVEPQDTREGNECRHERPRHNLTSPQF